MKTFTTILLTSLSLTLGACVADDTDVAADADAIGFRTAFKGFRINTSFIGGYDFSEFNLRGDVHKYSELLEVCVPYKENEVCFKPDAADIQIRDGEIVIKWYDHTFQGTDLKKSRWLLELDYDQKDGPDSSVWAEIDHVYDQTTPHGVKYWNYQWAYDPVNATGLITKYLEKGGKKVPVCEWDEETNSLASVALGNTSIDTTEGGDGTVHEATDVGFFACHSGAAGKAPSWGYVLHDLGHRGYESVIRVIRADYCNKGISFTEPGEVLVVDDALGINSGYDPSALLEGLASFEKGWLCVHEDGLRAATLGDVRQYCDVQLCKPDWTWKDLPDANIMTQLP